MPGNKRVYWLKCTVCGRKYELPREKGDPPVKVRIKGICSDRCSRRYDKERQQQ